MTASATAWRPDADVVLGGLKDFQRRTAEYAFRRMFLDASPARRFLVADEVGLGKTLVAKGVVAQTVAHLWDRTERIDVLYVCSNGAIARQNVGRLRLPGWEDTPLASRITMLPLEVHGLKNRKLNFVSLTPSTSFSLSSSLGRYEERILLVRMLRRSWGLDDAASAYFFAGGAEKLRFRDHLDYADERIDAGLQHDFVAAVRADEERNGERSLRARFDALKRHFPRYDSNPSGEIREERGQVVGALRDLLARSCLKALEPDLIILDEFQRFSHLLELGDEDDEAKLARDLFNYADERTSARVLLLSATPYKMLTLAGVDDKAENHYEDLLRTLAFLHDDIGVREQYRERLSRLRRAITRQPMLGVGEVQAAREELVTSLRLVMARTERLACASDRGGMLQERAHEPLRLVPGEVLAYRRLAHLARHAKYGDPLEFWKSAPYALSFLEGYVLHKKVLHQRLAPAGGLVPEAALEHLSLRRARVQHLESVEPGSSRMRWLFETTLGDGSWQLLWVPPSRPRYRLGEPFGSRLGLTKTLIFSAWAMVPKAIASLLSYEAERRLVEREGLGEYDRLHDEISAPLRLDGKAASVLIHLYPSWTLAQVAHEALRDGDGLHVGDVRRRLEGMLAGPIGELTAGAAASGREDDRWYWMAPVLLDAREDRNGVAAWFTRPDAAEAWLGLSAQDEASGDEADGRSAFARELLPEVLNLLENPEELGHPPADLGEVVADAAIGGFANAALGAVAAVWGERDRGSARDAAGRIANALRGMFNQPPVVAHLREALGRPYWRVALDYAIAGDLGAVLAEYLHLQPESLGVVHSEVGAALDRAAEEAERAIGLVVASLTVEDFRLRDGIIDEREKYRVRVKYALRLGGDKDRDAEGKDRKRLEEVKTAFNSPFWPFVLASTSIGQEGLDFHHYCHRIVHWNLPGNPVDLEQREGRIHRYKNHAVRRNIAHGHSAASLVPFGADPWKAMFDAARGALPVGTPELQPYWVCTDGPARIQRCVPNLPLSRDVERYERLRRMLTVYRMAFGQPRQDDLVEFLLREVPEAEHAALAEAARVDLSPPVA